MADGQFFGAANRALESLVQTRISPQFQLSQMALKEKQKLSAEANRQSAILRNYLASADLTERGAIGFMQDIAAITGSTQLVQPIAEQLIKENAFEAGQEELRNLRTLTQESLQKFQDPESELGEQISEGEADELTIQQSLVGKRGIEAAKVTKGLGAALPKPEDLSKKQQQVFANEKSLRTEYTKLSKDFVTQRDSFGRIQASAEDPSAAGDLALVFNYMKLLDPGSVVRESEYANARNAAGVPEKIRRLYNRVIDGEQLGQNQRNDFVNRAGRIYNKAQSQHEKRGKEYSRLARKAGVDPENVVIDLDIAQAPAERAVDIAPAPGKEEVIPSPEVTEQTFNVDEYLDNLGL